MADMYTIIENLCNERNISIAQMCRDTGLRQSVFSELKHGRTKNLSAKNIVILANYFGVSTDVFTGQPNPGDIFRDIAHTIAVGEIKTPEPKTEREVIISEIMAVVESLSFEDLKSFHRLIVK
jgi:transcriptional regulator with XRE-family HTH domain